MKTFLLIISLFSISAASNSAWSQEIKTIRDIGVWAQLGLKYELNNKWTTSISQGVRTFDDALSLKKLVTDADINYKINKLFKLGFGLRYAYGRKKDLIFTNDIRYNFDFNFKKEIVHNLDLKYRFRFQHNYRNLFNFVPDINQRSHIRNKLELQYELEKHTVYFASELFREFVSYKDPEFNSLRLSLGDQIENKLGEFDYAIVYERELNDKYPLDFFFLNLKYTFKLKHE